MLRASWSTFASVLWVVCDADPMPARHRRHPRRESCRAAVSRACVDTSTPTPRGVRLAPALKEALMLTDSRITAIVPTTDLARARTFFGETLGLTESGAPAPGPQVIYRCGGDSLLEVYERPT